MMRWWSQKVTVQAAETVLPVETEDVEKLQSIPESIQKSRTCIIYHPSKPATQSGRNQTLKIRLFFDKQTMKWESRVLGWTSSSDSVQGLEMQFDSVAAAVEYCEKQGLEYAVRPSPNLAALKPKLYADNFRYSADKLRLIRTK